MLHFLQSFLVHLHIVENKIIIIMQILQLSIYIKQSSKKPSQYRSIPWNHMKPLIFDFYSPMTKYFVLFHTNISNKKIMFTIIFYHMSFLFQMPDQAQRPPAPTPGPRVRMRAAVAAPQAFPSPETAARNQVQFPWARRRRTTVDNLLRQVYLMATESRRTQDLGKDMRVSI